MSIIQWNCRGIASSFEQLKTLFRDANAKIMCLQETKLGDRTYNPGLNYNFYKSPPLPGERSQGGTGIIVHKSIKHSEIPLNTVLQACAVQIQHNKKITLCSLYLEPKLEDHITDNVGNRRQLELRDLENLINQLPSPFLLMGDFNAKHTLWGSNVCDRWGNIIEELVDNNDLVIMNDGSPTRYDQYHNTSSAIDISLCSSDIRLDYEWSVDGHLYGSDHWPIHLKYVQNIPYPCPPKWKIKEARWKEYKETTKIEKDYVEFPSPLEAYDHLNKVVMENSIEHIPRTSGKPHRPLVPWWNKKCQLVRKITRTCFRRYLRSPCEANKIAYARAKAKQKRVFKKAKRSSWRKYISEINIKTPSSKVWTKIRKLQGKFTPSPLPTIKMGETYISDPKQVADILGQHFSNICSASQYLPEFQETRSNTINIPRHSNNTESYNLPFSMEELENSISNSSPTSPGEDDIRYEMLSNLPECSKTFVLDIFNGFWKYHSYPSSWKVEVVVPALKPGKNPELPTSYRPIALTSCLCKVFERMVNNRLMWLLESKKLLTNRQFGFRKNKCTLDPLLMLSREIQNAMAIQNKTVGIFFDLEKAYDMTWRGGILKQLIEWGIGGNIYAFIEEFLTDRYLKVRVGSELSKAYIKEEGVPQGSVLSVTLFAIAVNSLMECIPPGVQGTLFVDDLAVYCSASTSLEACRKLQAAINAVTKWADSKGFKFSPQKSKAVRFCRTRKLEEIPTLFLKDEILPYEDEVKFLGVIFDKKLTFNPHIIDLANRVKKTINILKVVSHMDWGADRTTLLRLYTTLCLSKIDYACQIYGSAAKTTLERLDVVHNLGLRICTGAYRTSPVDSLYVDSGIPPLSIRRQELGLRYLTKIKALTDNPNYKYVSQPINRSTNKPRMPKPLEVRQEIDMRDIDIPSEKVAKIETGKMPPWCRPSNEICLPKIRKKSKSDYEIKSEFLEHASVHNNSIPLYTDASKSEDGVGIAVVGRNFSIKKKLLNDCSVYTAETYAVLLAIKQIFTCGKMGEKYLIYSDSRSVLSSLKQLMPASHLVQEVQEWLSLVQVRKKLNVSLCWVPAHVGIEGNEQADKAAREAALSTNVMNFKVPYTDFKEKIFRFSKEKWQERWSSLQSNLKLKIIKPHIGKWEQINSNRRVSIVLTRLRIGHTHLTHSFLLKSGDDRQVPYCNVCRSDITVRHILLECSVFNIERRRHSLHGRTMGELLGDNCPVEALMSFLINIDVFYKL